VERIVRPTIEGLASEGHPYQGVLYCGLMLTGRGPRVLEYNARFGDPETQVLMPRLDEDWLPLLHACATGGLQPSGLRWKSEAAVCVVMSSGGYPGKYAKGLPIDGLEKSGTMPGVTLFHAGTGLSPAGSFVTTGGRVLGVTALGEDLEAARDLAYRAVGGIHWDGEHHRTDIALDAVGRGAEAGS
jgi:phosphoribosylamine--glycine ligase